MENKIAQAINTKHTLSIDYDPGNRVIEPHVLGFGSKGQILLRAYQVSGARKSGEPEHWKLFRIDRIEDLRITDDVFEGPRPLYNPDDSVMKGGIIARV